MRDREEIEFLDYRQPLTNTRDLKYLGRFLSANDYDWPMVVANLRKVQKKWTRVSRILVWG